MNTYRNFTRPLAEERGMALISALLLLLVISLLAVGLSMDSSMDIRAAAYQKFRARALGSAESGMMAAADILESNIDETGWDTALPFVFPHLSAEYDDYIPGTVQIVGNGSFYNDQNLAETQTMAMTGEISSDVIIQKIDSTTAQGGAMQVAAGYAGMGKGLGGGGAYILYNIQSTGKDADNCSTCVAMNYRVVTK